MITWHLETFPIKSLKKHPKNPRQISRAQYQQLKINIAKFGLIDKPFLNLDNSLIGGHQRIRVMKDLGHLEIECWVPNQQLTQEEVDELCIRHNINHGDFDFDILANEWEPLDLLEWGFTEEQLVGKFEEDENKPAAGEKKSKKKTCPACGHEF